MIGFALACALFTLGFESGGGATLEKGLGADIGDYKPAISYGAEIGLRDILPGIGCDIGFRRFGIEKNVDGDSITHLERWEGAFYDVSAVFESWPFLEGPLGIKLRTGGFISPWRMLEDGEVIGIAPKDTSSDTIHMEATSFGVIVGGSIMFRPWSFLVFDLGVNHRHVFSMDVENFGKTDTDERFMEVYLAARFRF